MAHEQPASGAPRYGAGRLEAFSDGVFAIAITLLVLEIGVPDGSGDNLLRAVAEQWPSYLAYLVSFATIGAIWIEHTVITEFLDRATAALVRLNLLLLLLVSLLPFTTEVFGDYLADRDAARVAATMYGVNLFLASALISALWRYAVSEGLLKPGVDAVVIRTLNRRLAPSLAGYLAMIALGIVAPLPAVLGYLLIALYIIVPVRAFRLGDPERRGVGHD